MKGICFNFFFFLNTFYIFVREPFYIITVKLVGHESREKQNKRKRKNTYIHTYIKETKQKKKK